MKFKLYISYYGDGSVSFRFNKLCDLLTFDRQVMSRSGNEICRVEGLTNAVTRYVGQLYINKRGSISVKF